MYLVPDASSIEYFTAVVLVSGAHDMEAGNVKVLQEAGRGAVLNIDEATVDLLGTPNNVSGMGTLIYVMSSRGNGITAWLDK